MTIGNQTPTINNQLPANANNTLRLVRQGFADLIETPKPLKVDADQYTRSLKALCRYYRQNDIQAFDPLREFIHGDEDREQSTRQRYSLTITQFYLWLQLTNRVEVFKNKQLVKDDLDQYRNWLIKRMAIKEPKHPLKLSRNTVLSYLTVVRQFYKWWEIKTQGEDTPVINHAKGLKNPKDKEGTKLFNKKPLKAEQIQDFKTHLNSEVLKAKEHYNKVLADFEAIDTYKGTAQAKARRQVNKASIKLLAALRNKAFLYLMYYNCFRVSSIYNLDRKDVVLTKKRIFFLEKGKTEKRQHALIPDVYEALKEYLDSFKISKDEPLFQCLSGRNVGGRLSKVTISQTAKKAFYDTGVILRPTDTTTIGSQGLPGAKPQTEYTEEENPEEEHTDPKDYTAHSLRHTGATHLYKKDVPLNLIRHFMGHKSITTTEKYALHVEEENLLDNPINQVLQTK